MQVLALPGFGILHYEDTVYMDESSQFVVLQRIAEFSARLRGHELGTWHTEKYSATAACSKCGCTMIIYTSLLQPEIDGTALGSA